MSTGRFVLLGSTIRPVGGGSATFRSVGLAARLALGAGFEDGVGFGPLGGGLFLGRLAARQGSGADRAAEGEKRELLWASSRRHRSRTPWSAARAGCRRGWSRCCTRPGRPGT